MSRPDDHAVRMRRVRCALEGLSVGDAFGARVMAAPASAARRVADRVVPLAPWTHTAETAMACAVAAVLDGHGVDRDALARALAERYERDPDREYAEAMHWVLSTIAGGLPWSEAVASVEGAGAMGRETAARAALVGAYFSDDVEAAVEHARASAETTHAHPDAQAGAIAVAVAAVTAARVGERRAERSGVGLLDAVLAHVPAGPTREGIERARALIGEDMDIGAAAAALGDGTRGLCSDTVPVALYCAARWPRDFDDAMWTAAAGLGAASATGAIAGALAALSIEGGVPEAWRAGREPLDG